ncbi:MAG: hypothetical protein KIS96_11100 [Bauldia sp.]|nr:hypothetical protein [Bauldia sp.]
MAKSAKAKPKKKPALDSTIHQEAPNRWRWTVRHPETKAVLGTGVVGSEKDATRQVETVSARAKL